MTYSPAEIGALRTCTFTAVAVNISVATAPFVAQDHRLNFRLAILASVARRRPRSLPVRSVPWATGLIVVDVDGRAEECHVHRRHSS